jgi:hypothetical protein
MSAPKEYAMKVPACLRVAVVAFSAMMVACSSDSSVAPPATQPTTLSQVFSEMTLPALSGVASTLSSVPVTSAATPMPSTCIYSASSQSFTCPTVTTGGLTLTQSYTLLDASGKPQSQFDPSTTAAVRTTMKGTGTVSLTGSNTTGLLTVDEQQDQTLSGLLTGTHVLNGTMTMHMSGPLSIGTTTTSMNSTTTMTTTNLMLPQAGASAWPTSGTITEDMTSTVDAGSPAVSTHLTMTFNGTSKVAVVITLGGITQRCTMDMANPGLACA